MNNQSRLVRRISFGLIACLIAIVGRQASLAAPTARGAAKAASADAGTKEAAIDVNAADVEKLIELPGIGRAIAQRIVDYRKEHGPFKSVDELLNVRGIGERMLEKLRDRLTVGTKG